MWEIEFTDEFGNCWAGDKRFYDRMIPLAGDLYDTYLQELRKEGLI